MRPALFITVLPLLLTLLLAACGQTGSLYLPESTSATPSADPVPAQDVSP